MTFLLRGACDWTRSRYDALYKKNDIAFISKNRLTDLFRKRWFGKKGGYRVNKKLPPPGKGESFLPHER